MLKRSVKELDIEPTDIKYLQREFEGLSNDTLSKVLKNTSTQICEELGIHKGALRKYLETASLKCVAKLKSAFKNDQLQSAFIIQKETDAKPAIKFDDGGKMDDELFSKVTEEIRECRFATDKIAIIKSEIHSIADLVDILEGDYIFDEEFTMVFKSMQDIELALLVKRLPEYMDASGKSFTETENDWELKLMDYLKTVDLRRNNQIREIADNLAENS
jgi:predicted AlkP superfamily phosphohydrolase/phosphomutase